MIYSLTHTLSTTITCNSCFSHAVTEEELDIVSVPMAENVNQFPWLKCQSVPMAENVNQFPWLKMSIVLWRNFISSELLKLENEWLCPTCNSCKETIKDTSFIQSTSVLVIHFKTFIIEHEKVFKENQFFKCFPEDPTETRITGSNEISFFNN